MASRSCADEYTEKEGGFQALRRENGDNRFSIMEDLGKSGPREFNPPVEVSEGLLESG